MHNTLEYGVDFLASDVYTAAAAADCTLCSTPILVGDLAIDLDGLATWAHASHADALSPW